MSGLRRQTTFSAPAVAVCLVSWAGGTAEWLPELPRGARVGGKLAWGAEDIRCEHADLAVATVPVTIALGGYEGGLPGAHGLGTHQLRQGALCGSSKPL